MTAVPQRTAISHAFGALAATLVGIEHYHYHLVECSARALSRVEMAALGFEVMFGSLTITGSFMAFGKLQGFIPSPPITYKFQNQSNIGLFFVAVLLFLALVVVPTSAAIHPVLFYLMVAGRPGRRRADRAADRRGRHAGGDLAAELLRRPGFVGDGLRLAKQRADHRRGAGRGERLHALDPDEQGDEPLVRQRAVRRVRRRRLPARRGGRIDGRQNGPQHHGRRRRHATGLRPQRDRHSRLRHGGGPGPARGARAGRADRKARRRSEVRHPSGRRPDAGPHERAAGRGQRALRQAVRHGRDQRRILRGPTWRW